MPYGSGHLIFPSTIVDNLPSHGIDPLSCYAQQRYGPCSAPRRGIRNMHMRIRIARTNVGLSQAELASRLGIQRSAVANWESPTGALPATGHLIRLAEITNATMDWLATGRGAPQGGVPGISIFRTTGSISDSYWMLMTMHSRWPA